MIETDGTFNEKFNGTFYRTFDEKFDGTFDRTFDETFDGTFDAERSMEQFRVLLHPPLCSLLRHDSMERSMKHSMEHSME